MSNHCEKHRRYKAGCLACAGRPILQSRRRTAADEEYVEALLADLTDAGIAREQRVSRAAERCSQILADPAGWR